MPRCLERVFCPGGEAQREGGGSGVCDNDLGLQMLRVHRVQQGRRKRSGSRTV